MKQISIVKTGEGYSDNEYTFEKESDAIEFFQLLGKATILTKDYISYGIGYVYTESESKHKASITYGNLCSNKELQELKEKEKALAAEDVKKAASLETIASENDTLL